MIPLTLIIKKLICKLNCISSCGNIDNVNDEDIKNIVDIVEDIVEEIINQEEK